MLLRYIRHAHLSQHDVMSGSVKFQSFRPKTNTVEVSYLDLLKLNHD